MTVTFRMLPVVYSCSSTEIPPKKAQDETHHQPQQVEQTPTLQDGGDGDIQKVVEGKLLDRDGRSQRCLAHHSNTY